jgi:hypothetical protein
LSQDVARAEDTVVKITIGRIDIHQPAAPSKAQATLPRHKAKLSLEDYLATRSSSRGGKN